MMINPNNGLTAEPKRNTPRDVFLHLFAMVALYWSAISFITLCWQYINYFFPDVLTYGYQDLSYSIRFAVSSLVIIFPLFILASWLLNKIYAKESAVRESKIRKWLIYLTLFITALVMIGDLIYVINIFLGGVDVTPRFLLKALSILVVSGIIFWYYLDDVRKDTPSVLAKYVAWASIAVMTVSVIGAFFIIGSPANARLAQLDQQRTNDLQDIQYQIVNYWQRKNVLPATLADLNDSISGYAVPTDPQNQTAYEYVPNNNATAPSFELCATFGLESNLQAIGKPVPAYPVYGDVNSQNWDHSAGRVCFKRNIDKQLYPPIK